MQGTSKVFMGATLVMVVSLAIVFGLILVLLAELYCSLLLRRRRRPQMPNSITTVTPSRPPPTAAVTSPSLSPPLFPTNQCTVSLSSFFSHGVVCAPRNSLFPKKVNNEPKTHHFQLHQAIDMDETRRASPPFSAPPIPVSGVFSQIRKTAIVEDVKACCAGKDILYISNPIFDEDMCRMKMEETPFETPYSSPSGLQKIGSSSSSSSQSPVSDSPPLTPMEKVPAEVCSVSLEDAIPDNRNNDSNSNNGVSSSSTGPPRTSASW